MNTFGKNLRLTTFGESHGPAMGGVLDGVPPRIRLDFDLITVLIDERRTGTSTLVSARKESDTPEFLSGLSPEGVTLGTPLAFIIRNTDQRSSDYDELRHVYRPNHADYAYDVRYGIRDWRGGGRSSARETVNRVVAGAIAMQILRQYGVTIEAGIISVGESGELPFREKMAKEGRFDFPEELAEEMRDEVERARRDCDSVGGMVGCAVYGIPPGIGDPVFGKLQSALASAMMSINAAKGFDYGYGFDLTSSRGLATADTFLPPDEPTQTLRLTTATNYSGGIQGGISNGMPVYMRVAFKPTPSVATEQATVDDQGRKVILGVRGRHDPCVALRGVPIVKAMAALVVADMLLETEGRK